MKGVLSEFDQDILFQGTRKFTAIFTKSQEFNLIQNLTTSVSELWLTFCSLHSHVFSYEVCKPPCILQPFTVSQLGPNPWKIYLPRPSFTSCLAAIAALQKTLHPAEPFWSTDTLVALRRCEQILVVMSLCHSCSEWPTLISVRSQGPAKA
jgi:hypothetical protein